MSEFVFRGSENYYPSRLGELFTVEFRNFMIAKKMVAFRASLKSAILTEHPQTIASVVKGAGHIDCKYDPSPLRLFIPPENRDLELDVVRDSAVMATTDAISEMGFLIPSNGAMARANRDEEDPSLIAILMRFERT